MNRNSKTKNLTAYPENQGFRPARHALCKLRDDIAERSERKTASTRREQGIKTRRKAGTVGEYTRGERGQKNGETAARAWQRSRRPDGENKDRRSPVLVNVLFNFEIGRNGYYGKYDNNHFFAVSYLARPFSFSRMVLVRSHVLYRNCLYVGCHMLLALSPRFFTAMSMYSSGVLFGFSIASPALTVASHVFRLLIASFSAVLRDALVHMYAVT